jgi:hypothetical protein
MAFHHRGLYLPAGPRDIGPVVYGGGLSQWGAEVENLQQYLVVKSSNAGRDTDACVGVILEGGAICGHSDHDGLELCYLLVILFDHLHRRWDLKPIIEQARIEERFGVEQSRSDGGKHQGKDRRSM